MNARHFGHCSSLSISRLCLEGMIEGKRNRGRPRKRWMDNIFEWAERSAEKLNYVSQNREIWRTFTHVCAQSGLAGDGEP